MFGGAFTVLFSLFSATGPQSIAERCEVRIPDAAAKFTVEVADEERERQIGLMSREYLPENEGMLFIFEKPVEVGFWMRDTLIPLDMIFIDKNNVIRKITTAKPLDETQVPGAYPDDPDPLRVRVLEIGGGLSEKSGIREGMRIEGCIASR